MVQAKPRGGLGLHDPQRKARALFASRWLTAERAPPQTLAGAWLTVRRQRHGDEGQPPARAGHFRELQRAAQHAVDVLVGKELTAAILKASVEERPPTPRAMRGVSVADQATVWSRVLSKHVPADARSSWFEAVDDVLPTAIRLQAANMAEAPDCPKCGAPEDVTHRVSQCGDSRKEAWIWAQLRISALTGAVVEAGAITRPLFKAEGPGGRAAVWLLGLTVHFLATRRTFSAEDLQDFIATRSKDMKEGGEVLSRILQ
ncbi:hypothetical protein ONE63_011165 [Megalurothrips usitatus]|uniref:Reverse transcriptase zinc-binding domain-containing protein n=1 Tax=Megalurothrips usitatus TaxID=439358 RepID=A0AAV7X2K0_9NEOP|nr:hypothetical protein ONE63_011165 [Megalurothrips usitatus]